MLKKIVIVLLFLVSIPCLVFSQQKIKPGVVITKDNYRKYLDELNQLSIPSYREHVIDGVKKGYMKATENNLNNRRIGPKINSLDGKGGALSLMPGLVQK